MKDNEIIDLYFARNENAISETAQKYGRMLKAIAYGILKNVSDCEECENDTYFAAWNKIPPQIPKALAAFLGRITRNIALDKYAYYTADKRNREFERRYASWRKFCRAGRIRRSIMKMRNLPSASQRSCTPKAIQNAWYLCGGIGIVIRLLKLRLLTGFREAR